MTYRNLKLYRIEMYLVLAHRVDEGAEFYHKGNLVAKLTVKDLKKGEIREVSFEFEIFEKKFITKSYSIKGEEKVYPMNKVEISIGLDTPKTQEEQIPLRYAAPKYLKIWRF